MNLKFRVQSAATRPAFWAWLALVVLPPELIRWSFNLQWVDPAYLALAFAWWPVDTLGRLGALQALMPTKAKRRPWQALRASIAADVLMSLRSSVLALLGLVPALALLSLAGVASPAMLALELALALLGLVPTALYLLRCVLAPAELLKKNQSGSEALAASKARLHGRLGAFLKMALPWLLAGWVCDGLGMLFPDPVGVFLGPLSLGLALVPLAAAAD